MNSEKNYTKIISDNLERGEKIVDMEYLKYCLNSRGISKEEVCVYLNISLSSLYKRLRGVSEWSLGEIKGIRERLGLTDDEVKKIFDI